MAKIKVLGNTVQLVSALTLDDIKEVQKYAPDALIITETVDEVSEPVFKITAGADGSVTDYGIVFDGKTRAGKAAVSMNINFDGSDEELVGAIADKLMKPVTYLRKLEASVPEKLAAVKEAREAFINSIEIE